MSALDAARLRKPKLPNPVGRRRSRLGAAMAAVRRLRSRATLIIATAGFSAIMIGIVCNAVLFQKGHRPSPLFGSAQRSEPPPSAAPPPKTVEAPPAPPPSPTRVTAPVPETPMQGAAPEPLPAMVRRTATAPLSAAAHHPFSRPGLDPIARLLRGDPIPSAKHVLAPSTRSSHAPAAEKPRVTLAARKMDTQASPSRAPAAN